MSRPADLSLNLTNGGPEEKKISFRGLEKCLEAFTSGEGRVVRRYARLFSQLSGRRQEEDEEAISWSSSDEDDRGALNSSVCRRTRVTRKLNSQINFDNRINAKRNGRRVTSAEFSRSVEYVSQDLFANTQPLGPTPNQNSQVEPGDTSSVFNNGILIDESQNLTVEPENTEIRDAPSTPRPKDVAVDSDMTSPVFKLTASRKKKHRVKKGKAGSQKSREEKLLCVPEPLPSINNNILADVQEPLFALTPENKIDGMGSIESPVLGRSISSYKDVTSPVLNRTPSISPVMRRTVRRKRPHSLPVPKSPILEPKKKTASFKRKRRKLATPKSCTQSWNITLNSTDIGTSEAVPSHSVDQDSLKSTVKRSLDFALDEEDHRPEADFRIETNSEELTDQPVQGDPVSFPEEDLPEIAEIGLNATNVIEEVCTEELDLSVMPKIAEPKRSRLSLRNCRKRRSVSVMSSPEVIENSQTQDLVGTEATGKSEDVFKAPLSRAVRRAGSKKSKPAKEEPTQKPDILNQTNMIEEVYTEDLLADQNFSRGSDGDAVSPSVEEILSPNRETDVPGEDCVIESLQNSQSSPEEEKIVESRSKMSKTLAETSEEMHKEFRSYCPSKDQELIIISQSSTKSGDALKSTEAGSPEIESVSSQASRGNKETSGPSTGTISKSNSTRSPAVSSPLVISSAGSSPGVGSADQPFVIIEDEYNAAPKRRSKKNDPNGIAHRLQRLLNQRRSAARIWQYKRSKLSRLNNGEEEKVVQESQGRELRVLSVRTDHSHIVLLSKEEDKREPANGKEFRDNVLVVLDPGVVLRLGKVMNASRIKIFPPWQSMDINDRDVTVVLGANIVEVLSTHQGTNPADHVFRQPATVKRYACHCSTLPPPDAVMLECWDGVQSMGLLSMLFPLSAAPATQLVQYDDTVTSQTPLSVDQNNLRGDHSQYTVKALLSAQSTTSHGRGLLVLTVLRVFCYWQRGFGLTSKRSTLPYWSVFGRDASDEVCELILGPVENADAENRLDWSDFVTGRSLGKKYKFRGVAVSQRLDRSRLCREWDVVPEQQKIVYILAPSNRFSFTNADTVSQSGLWEPKISNLADYVQDDANQNGPNKLARVSFVCKFFHANEHALYVADQSVSPQLHPILLRPSVFVPPAVVAAVQKPKPSKVLILLQDVEASKARIVADKYSRLIILNDNGLAYPEDNCARSWPANLEGCSLLRGIKVLLPQLSPRSRTHNLVKLKGVVCDLDETSALMWPACGICGSPVDTDDEAPHYCSRCARVSQELIVHMSLVVYVKVADFPSDTSIRVKILHKTVEALLRTIPQEGQDIMVREAVGKPIGPIRCEVTAAHGGNFVLTELPSSLWM